MYLSLYKCMDTRVLEIKHACMFIYVWVFMVCDCVDQHIFFFLFFKQVFKMCLCVSVCEETYTAAQEVYDVQLQTRTLPLTVHSVGSFWRQYSILVFKRKILFSENVWTEEHDEDGRGEMSVSVSCHTTLHHIRMFLSTDDLDLNLKFKEQRSWPLTRFLSASCVSSASAWPES